MKLQIIPEILLKLKNENATILLNERITDGIWQMEMEAPFVVSGVEGPGQFINISVSPLWDLPLRRPMSIAGIKQSNLKIVYKLAGKGTLRLSQKKPGEKLDILGPLGNTFSFKNINSLYPILAAGGTGIAPILWIHQILIKKQIKHDFVCGAVTSSEHFLEHEPDRRIFLTTDDGSLGEKGTILPTLKRLINEQNRSEIYACGPEPMVKAIIEYIKKSRIPCQVALESYMACGVGICQSCVVEMKNHPVKNHSYQELYSLVCKNGPVYNAYDIRI